MQTTCLGGGVVTADGHCMGSGPKDLGVPQYCPIENPINQGTGNKFQVDTDYKSIGENGLVWRRYYNSLSSANENLGSDWRGEFNRNVSVVAAKIFVSRPDGKVYLFTANGSGGWASDADVKSALVQIANGWRYSNIENDEVELYDNAGKLRLISARNGYTQTLTYSDGTNGVNGGYILSASGSSTSNALPIGLLIRVTDSYNRTLNFGYDVSGRIVKIVDPLGGSYLYAYDANNNLTSVIYPDGKIRTYVYNESTNTSGTNLPNALTGILDENNNRFGTYKYDTQGRAISTEHAGGAHKAVIAYTTDANGNVTSSAVTDALNTTRTYSFTNILGVVKNTGVTQPCNSGCGAASATTYDVNGNIASRTDFNGNVTHYVYDLSRNLETSRTEAYGTPQARTITTQWHATYRLPTLITEPGKTTSFNYDASGNLLSKTITDTAFNKSRTWTYTYNALGQVLTADGPRTDVSDITTYSYYASASNVAGSVHSIGDLATVTNAAGLVTSITNYDLNGRPLSITDPNGVVTTLTYAPRGWLKTKTVNGVQTTQYDYDGVGQLIKVTLPDASYLSYTYDTAHRLTDIADNSGNKIHYTLDAMGNRLQEDTKDPSSSILKTRSRVFDSLNRLQKDIGGTSPSTQITQYGYDNNGNLKTITDPLNHVTTNGYDALNRLITVTDPANGVSSTSYNALDQVTQVKDPRLVTTNYTINALGDVTLTQSPDSGNTNQVYDLAGNVTQKTDARGVVSNYTYDALNRVTSITYPASSSENVTFTYDDTVNTYHRQGRLTSMTDGGGTSMSFSYDAYGNVTALVDLSSVYWSLASYQYDMGNRLQQITYPSGRIVIYTRNTLGQIVQVQTKDNANAALQTVISNATYEPFGPLKSLTYGNGVTTTFAHDVDYRISRITTTANPLWDVTYSYDAAGNLTSITDQNPDTANYSSFSYDALNRLITDANPGASYSYQYDAGGNRTQRTSFLTPTTQQYAADSNRETTYGSYTLSTDAAGNLTARGVITAMAYSNANRLRLSTKNSTNTFYRYNGLGYRNVKTTGTSNTHYSYLPDGKYLAQRRANSADSTAQIMDYLWLDEVPIAQAKTLYANNAVTSRRLTYIHSDHLTTPRLMTDANQTVVWRWMGDGYGLNTPETNPDGDSLIDTLDLRMPGQIYDSETGLFYNMHRYYDPQTVRYTQSDPIGLQGGLNTYGYVLDNPILLTDPTGLVCHYEDYGGNLVKVCDGKGGTGDSADHGTGDNAAGMTGLVPADLDIRTIEEIEKDLKNKQCRLVVYTATAVPCIYSKEAGKAGSKACSAGRKLLYKIVCDSDCGKLKPPQSENP